MQLHSHVDSENVHKGAFICDELRGALNIDWPCYVPINSLYSEAPSVIHTPEETGDTTRKRSTAVEMVQIVKNGGS